MRAVLERVLALTKQIESDRSDFVRQPAYEKFLILLEERRQLLIELMKLYPPPSTPDEIELVNQASTKYDALIDGLKEARDEMNLYLAAHGN